MTGTIRTHGKCILAGEHSVVRGGEALVFPLHSRGLSLGWEEAASPSVPEGAFAVPFQKAWERALSLSGFTPTRALRVRIASDIPVRAGLGSSAALSVAVARLLEEQGAQIPDLFALAIEIENLFHGKSSGIDVASVLTSSPIAYRKNSPPAPLAPVWRPALYLADTGLRSSTKDCVAKVEAARRPDLDERMQEAVKLAREALARADGETALAEAIRLARSCFSEWELGSPALENHLLEAGALAVKPTGSGGGGFLLSLWKSAPPPALGLIPVSADFSRAP